MFLDIFVSHIPVPGTIQINTVHDFFFQNKFLECTGTLYGMLPFLPLPRECHICVEKNLTLC